MNINEINNISTDVTSLLSNACLVVAHPDDEILWFSSIIEHTPKIIVCFLSNTNRPKLTRGRQAVLDNYPLDALCSLNIKEADVYDRAHWPLPVQTTYGVKLTGSNKSIENRYYQMNHRRIVDLLTEQLAGFDTIFTHNPWGEYGHEEHVQVYRAVQQVQQKSNFDLWVSHYVSSRSHALKAHCLDTAKINYFTLPTKPRLADKIAAQYKANNAWTWFDTYQWPENESFLNILAAPEQSQSTPQAIPLNYLNMGIPATPLADQSIRSVFRKLKQLC